MIVIIAGLLVHGGLCAGLILETGAIDAYAFRSLDSGEYYRIAQNVALHGVFSQSASPPLTPDTWRTPGYPLLLAFLMTLLGTAAWRLVLAHQLLSVLNAWLLYRVTRSRLGDRALPLALLALLEPYGLYYSFWLMSTTFFMTVMLAIWGAWHWTIEGDGYGRVTVLGALSGFAVLVRPVAVLVPGVVLVGLLMVAIRRHRSQSHCWSTTLGMPLTFVVCCALVVGCWMVRNHRVANHFALSHQSGVVTAYFKATEVELWRQGRSDERIVETSLDPNMQSQPHTVWEKIDQELKTKLASLPLSEPESLRWENLAQGNRTRVDSFVISQALREIGMSMMGASWIQTVECWMVRCAAILTFPLDIAIDPPVGLEPSRLKWAIVGLLYTVLGVGVLVRLARRCYGFADIYFPLAGVVALLVASSPQIDPRFRVPMIPLLLYVVLLPRRSQSEGIESATLEPCVDDR